MIEFGDIRKAMYDNNVEFILELLETSDFDAGFQGNILICWAGEMGQIEIIKRLLKRPEVDSGQSDSYPLRHAIKKGCAECVKLLLDDPKSDIRNRFNIGIDWAIDRINEKNGKEIFGLIVKKYYEERYEIPDNFKSKFRKWKINNIKKLWE